MFDEFRPVSFVFRRFVEICDNLSAPEYVGERERKSKPEPGSILTVPIQDKHLP